MESILVQVTWRSMAINPFLTPRPKSLVVCTSKLTQEQLTNVVDLAKEATPPGCELWDVCRLRDDGGWDCLLERKES